MQTGSLVAGAVLIGGAVYLLNREGVIDVGDLAQTFGLGPGSITGPLTPAELAAIQARTPGAGNAPIVASPAFASPQNLAAIGGVGVAALPLLGVTGVGLGLATAGIGLAVAFATYELLKQRASMHTNDVRDLWERQFVDLSRALGLPTHTETSVAPGTLEMADVIFYFDHDTSQRLWHAVQGTQDETRYRLAARNVDLFLTARGISVQDA